MNHDVTFTHQSDSVLTESIRFGTKAVESTMFCIEREGGKQEIHCCLSSQLGCVYSCTFCVSGEKGLDRNLSQKEIMYSLRLMESKASFCYPGFTGQFDRIDFMGSGELLSNPAWREVLSEIPPYKASIASVGSVSKIRKLAESHLRIHTFWLSLHGVRSEVRERLLPIAKRFVVEELIDATVAVKEGLGCKVRVNYLTYDFNTTEADAEELVRTIGSTDLTLQLSQPNGSLVKGALAESSMIDFVDTLRKRGFENRIVMFFSAKAKDQRGGCGMLRYSSE